jgi:DnaJ-class molecular chaperone
MEKGDCLMCKGTGRQWNDEIGGFVGPRCKVCKGTGRYPESIMMTKEKEECHISKLVDVLK